MLTPGRQLERQGTLVHKVCVAKYRCAMNRITLEPGKRGGRPCIRGLRITVYDVLSMLSSGMTQQEIQDDSGIDNGGYLGRVGLRRRPRASSLFLQGAMKLLLDEDCRGVWCHS